MLEPGFERFQVDVVIGSIDLFVHIVHFLSETPNLSKNVVSQIDSFVTQLRLSDEGAFDFSHYLRLN